MYLWLVEIYFKSGKMMVGEINANTTKEIQEKYFNKNSGKMIKIKTGVYGMDMFFDPSEVESFTAVQLT